jgi:hypothetical protein
MSEKEWQRQVTDLADKLHIMWWWQKPSRLPNGRVVTAGQGSKGYPDLTFAKNGRVLFLELKADGRKPTPEQERWVANLPNAYVAWPDDWPRVEALLRAMA